MKTKKVKINTKGRKEGIDYNLPEKNTIKGMKANYGSIELKDEVVAYIFPVPVKRVLGYFEGMYYNGQAIRANKIKIIPITKVAKK